MNKESTASQQPVMEASAAPCRVSAPIASSTAETERQLGQMRLETTQAATIQRTIIVIRREGRRLGRG